MATRLKSLGRKTARFTLIHAFSWCLFFAHNRSPLSPNPFLTSNFHPFFLAEKMLPNLWRRCMAASQALLLTHSDFVEVSGWDKNEIFFVEKAELSTDDAAKKYISLEHMLAEGAIV